MDAMTIDHLSFGTRDMPATRHFYEQQLGFEVLIHERMLIEEGGEVDHIFFHTGNGCALAFMQWHGTPGVATEYDAGINNGLGVPAGTFHFALRCDSLEALQVRHKELRSNQILVGPIIDLPPYKSFFFDDPNGIRLEYTTRVAAYKAEDKDPVKRTFTVNLDLFKNISKPV
jgi:catechol 2,3-dioxygenase-like lactoylglutathione lyase family enzyme